MPPAHGEAKSAVAVLETMISVETAVHVTDYVFQTMPLAELVAEKHPIAMDNLERLFELPSPWLPRPSLPAALAKFPRTHLHPPSPRDRMIGFEQNPSLDEACLGRSLGSVFLRFAPPGLHVLHPEAEQH